MSLPLALILMAAACVTAAAEGAPAAPDAIDALVSARVEAGEFSGAVLVADSGGVLFRKAYGPAVREWEIPNTPETRFRVGSLTKPMTATAVLRLVEQGRLSLDDTLVEVLPWYRSDTGARVTIGQLLRHTSGIDRSGVKRMFAEAPTARITLREEIEAYCSGDLEWEPGTEFGYNNAGYLILSAVIEEITGMPYAEALAELLLEPAGMADTGICGHRVIVPRMARGYEREDGVVVHPDYIEADLASGAGGAYSTVDDLYRWDRALYTDRLLQQSARDLMFTPGVGPYGCGWFVLDMPVGPGGENRTVVRHPGQGDGFWSILWRIPDDEVLVVLINNLGRADLGSLAVEILAVVYGASAAADR